MSSPAKKAAAAPQVLDAALRPSKWDEYVGQKQVKANIRVAIDAAKKRGAMPEHILFYGPPGVGKTTLAHLIASTLGSSLKNTSGVAIERAGDLAAILTNLEPNTVLFIDEIHRLSRKIEELLYPALESGHLDLVLGKGPSARTAELSGPLRSRFGGGIYQLDFYSDDDLRDIIRRSAKLLNLDAPDAVIERIAARSRATPRVANALLKRVRDFSEVHERELSIKLCDEACKLFGIDARGLTKDDRRYLETLLKSFRGGPAGVRAIASALHEDSDTVEHVYEPYLLRLGFIERSPRGRILTQNGRAYLSGGILL